MKITLRKRDSVTSAVLFLFNILGEYKDDHSINLTHLLECLQYFGKTEISIRTGLSRMVKAKILVNKKVDTETVYELTRDGLENISLWNRGLARFFRRYELRWSDWDQGWSFLVLRDFNKSEHENQFLMDQLEECGLREASNNLWITPYPIDNELIAILSPQQYLVFTGNLQSNLAPEELLNDIFKINLLRGKYAKFCERVEGYREQMDAASPGNLLPILFEAGWNFYDLVTSDPVLPSGLLPPWEGDKATNAMKLLRTELIGQIIDFFREKEV